MVSHSRQDNETQNWLDLVKLFVAMDVYASKGTTHQERAVRGLEYLKSRTQMERYQLLNIVTPRFSSPVVPEHRATTSAGDTKSADRSRAI